MDSQLLYYSVLNCPSEDEKDDKEVEILNVDNLHLESIAEKRPKKKKKKKSKRKKEKEIVYSLPDGDIEINDVNIYHDEENYDIETGLYHIRRSEDLQTVSNYNYDESIKIWVLVQPIGNFELKVRSSVKIEDMFGMIENQVLKRYQEHIEVQGVQLVDRETRKAIPIDWAVGEMMSNGAEMAVDYTSKNPKHKDIPFKNNELPEIHIIKSTKHAGPLKYQCPSKFVGLDANRALKRHLASQTFRIPKKLPQSKKGEEIRCPLTFCNVEDAVRHVKESTLGQSEDEGPDLRTFWERSEIELIREVELIREEEEEKQRKLDEQLKDKERKKTKLLKQKEKEENLIKERQNKANELKGAKEKKRG